MMQEKSDSRNTHWASGERLQDGSLLEPGVARPSRAAFPLRPLCRIPDQTRFAVLSALAVDYLEVTGPA